jgi:hypothetical protein
MPKEPIGVAVISAGMAGRATQAGKTYTRRRAERYDTYAEDPPQI